MAYGSIFSAAEHLKMVVLLVEDSPEQRMAYRRFLTRAEGRDFVLLEAETGEEGLEAVRSTVPDCILLDFRLPDMDGIAFLDALNHTTEARDVPVIMLTSQGNEQIAVAAMKRGASDYLTKQHLNQDLLLFAIDQAIERKRQEQFRSLLDAAPDAMVVTNADNRIVFVNAKTLRMFDYERDDLLEQPLSDLLPDPAPQPVQDVPDLTAVRQGQRRDGTTFWVEINESPVRLGDDELVSRALRDVTERLRAEAAIRASEERYRTLTAAAPDAIITADATGIILDWNAAATTIFGYRSADIIGQPLTRIMPPAYHDAHDAGIQRLRRGEEPRVLGQLLELEGLRSDGTVFPLELALSRWQAGNVHFYTAIIRDITTRRVAQEALERSELRNRAMLQAIPDAMVRMDRTGTYLDIHVPPNYGPMMDPAQVLGKRIEEVLPAHLQQIARETVARTLATGTIQRFEYETVVGGERRVREARVAPCGPEEVVSIQRDITLRKTAEEALQQSEALLRTVVTNIPVILFAVDHKRRLTLLEGKGLDVLNVAPGQGVGLSVERVFRDVPAILEGIEQTFAGQPASHRITQQSFAFECAYGALTDSSDNVVGVIGVATDVTAMVASQEALAESQQALRKLAAYLQSVREGERTRLSREVHDVLGQAMTALKMDVTWLERSLTPDDDNIRGRIDDMKQQIDETIQVVRRIASDLRPGILDDLGVAAAITWQAQRFEQRTGITCNIAIPVEPTSLDGPRATALFRIFQETLTNIARHAEATTVTIELVAMPEDVTLCVRDDGRGIRPEEIEQTRSLGLLGMRERVVPWGGHVTFHGKPNQGTTVEVWLPLDA